MKFDHFFNSSLLLCAQYQDFRLLLQFNSGKSYIYYDVPYRVYKELIESESAGKYYNRHIKSCYRSQEV